MTVARAGGAVLRRSPSTQMSVHVTRTTFAIPRSIGPDGAVHGRRGFNDIGQPTQANFRSDDDLATFEIGEDFTSHTTSTDEAVIWSGQTTDGYVVITSTNTANTATIWFCDTFDGTYTAVHTMRATNPLAISVPVVSRRHGKTVLFVGEYRSSQLNIASRLFGSFDGGQTWSLLRTMSIVDAAINSHVHCATWDVRSNRLWASFGDGPNAWFGHSDDNGSTWTEHRFASDDPLYTNSGQHQPACICALRDRIAICPDTGPFDTGIWQFSKTNIAPVATFSAAPVSTFLQYGTNPFGGVIGSLENYVAFGPSGSTLDKLIIAGTADGGTTWHQVYEQPLSGGSNSSGVVGPDANGHYWITSQISGQGQVRALNPPTWTAA